jgi:hypothetical protein
MRLLLPLLLLLAAPVAAEPLRFVAFGDMPYCNRGAGTACEAELARVEHLTEAINAARPAFSIFLGDTKAGGEACTDAIILDRTAAWFNRIRAPLVYTPGDNEWTDCWQARAGGFDPAERLALLRARFFSAPVSLGQQPMPLRRQADLDAGFRAYAENARWARDGIAFLTLHVPGSDNNRPQDGRPGTPPGAAQEYPARNAANLAWLREGFAAARAEGSRAVVVAMQADMYFRDRCGRGTVAGHADTREALAAAARSFGGPVLLLHGDSHFWLRDNPVPGVPNLTRVMVPGDGDTRAVVVTIDPDSADPYRFEIIGPDDRIAAPGCG